MRKTKRETNTDKQTVRLKEWKKRATLTNKNLQKLSDKIIGLSKYKMKWKFKVAFVWFILCLQIAEEKNQKQEIRHQHADMRKREKEMPIVSHSLFLLCGDTLFYYLCDWWKMLSGTTTTYIENVWVQLHIECSTDREREREFKRNEKRNRHTYTQSHTHSLTPIQRESEFLLSGW